MHRQHPDLVFIDGRWRNACFLATLLFARKEVLVVWDDYLDRPQYHLFESMIKPVKFLGRSAVYELQPDNYDAAEILEKYLNVFADWGILIKSDDDTPEVVAFDSCHSSCLPIM